MNIQRTGPSSSVALKKRQGIGLVVLGTVLILTSACSGGSNVTSTGPTKPETPSPSPSPRLADYLATNLPSPMSAEVVGTNETSGTATVATNVQVGSPDAGKICQTALAFVAASPAPSSAPAGVSIVPVTVTGKRGKPLAMAHGGKCGLQMPSAFAAAWASMCSHFHSYIRLSRKAAKTRSPSEGAALARQLVQLSSPFEAEAAAFARSGAGNAARDLRAFAAGNSQEWHGALAGDRAAYNAGWRKVRAVTDPLFAEVPPCQ